MRQTVIIDPALFLFNVHYIFAKNVRSLEILQKNEMVLLKNPIQVFPTKFALDNQVFLAADYIRQLGQNNFNVS